MTTNTFDITYSTDLIHQSCHIINGANKNIFQLQWHKPSFLSGLFWFFVKMLSRNLPPKFLRKRHFTIETLCESPNVEVDGKVFWKTWMPLWICFATSKAFPPLELHISELVTLWRLRLRRADNGLPGNLPRMFDIFTMLSRFKRLFTIKTTLFLYHYSLLQ